jgi:hypothetical protein
MIKTLLVKYGLPFVMELLGEIVKDMVSDDKNDVDDVFKSKLLRNQADMTQRILQKVSK